MAGVSNTAVGELAYLVYQERQQLETTEEQLLYRATQLRKADHFAYRNGQWQPLPYEGYAVLSVVDTNPGNEGLSDQLQHIQQQLQPCFESPAAYFPLPADSFHQTVANTLSADRFREQLVATGLEAEYPLLVSQAFANIPAATQTRPIAMRLVGLSLFSSAIGILGTFDDEQDFERILQFRERVYTNEALARLTVRRTRPFIGHITLAYLGADLSDEEKSRLVATCSTINQVLSEQPLHFFMSTTELRRYQHLAHFETRPGFPVYSFVKP